MTLLLYALHSAHIIFVSFAVWIKIPIITNSNNLVKFIYFEKATKFCEIFTLLLSYVVPVRIYELYLEINLPSNFKLIKKKYVHPTQAIGKHEKEKVLQKKKLWL